MDFDSVECFAMVGSFVGLVTPSVPYGGRRSRHSHPFKSALFGTSPVTQADIVSNKRLGAVLAKIQSDQRLRDEERLTSPKVTLREKRRIQAARARADAPLPRSGTPARPTSLLCGEPDISTLD